ncbi:hypothetical protein A0H81_13655 [Grifola frondosa]|uniref:Uncharacterized protein n=1 Tax=Grifola frondosa TaxID=5627 RepID=A0A1C7LNS6_GRIFR|nr:hypothetical protein A0H81_13655 [Grifola frondosa]
MRSQDLVCLVGIWIGIKTTQNIFIVWKLRRVGPLSELNICNHSITHPPYRFLLPSQMDLVRLWRNCFEPDTKTSRDVPRHLCPDYVRTVQRRLWFLAPVASTPRRSTDKVSAYDGNMAFKSHM